MTEMPEKEWHVQRQYKNSIFCDLFGIRKYALSLYNAITGRNYLDTQDFQIVTLEDILYCTMRNDLAVSVASNITLFEHQSTLSPNIVFRTFSYMGNTYEQWYGMKREEFLQLKKEGKATEVFDKFSNTPILIPAPRCYMLYNGVANAPESFEYHLSDLFLEPSPGYEWTVFMLNINAGYNRELMERCEPLRGYSIFVDLIRKNTTAGKTLEDAVAIALDKCIDSGILVDYFSKRRREVFNMATFEYTQEEALETRFLEGHIEGRAEGRAEGIAEGEAKGKAEGIAEGKQNTTVRNLQQLMKNLGLTLEKAMAAIGLPLSEMDFYSNLLAECK